MDFEWDQLKAERNLAKHQVDFDDAVAVFDDLSRLTEIDPRTYRELRHRTIGNASGRILLVVYTMRGEVCRIISARRASRRERGAYTLQTRN